MFNERTDLQRAVRESEAIRVISFQISDRQTQQLIEFAEKNLPWGKKTTAGVLKIVYSAAIGIPAKYILSLSGVKTNVDGLPSKQQQQFELKIGTLKKHNLFKDNTSFIAPLHDHFNVEGAPTLKDVAYLERFEAQCTQRRFWQDLLDAVKKGRSVEELLKERQGRRSLQVDEDKIRFRQLFYLVTKYGVDSLDLLSEGVSFKIVKENVELLEYFLKACNRVDLNVKLRAAYKAKHQEKFPKEVLDFFVQRSNSKKV